MNYPTCPYRKVCPKACPGDDEEEGQWVPGKFSVTPEKVTCLDWEVEFPNTAELQLEVEEILNPGGSTEGTEKKKRDITSQLKFNHSEGGKKAQHDFFQSDKGKLAQKKYYESPKGQEAHKRSQEKFKRIASAAKWIEANPGKTLDDYEEFLRGQILEHLEEQDRKQSEA